MSDTFKGLIDEGLRRVRDVQGLGTDRATVLELLGRLQGVVNIMLQSSQVDVAMPTTAWRTVYPLHNLQAIPGIGYAPEVGTLRQVTVDDVELVMTPFSTLPLLSTSWFRDVGSRFEACSVVGRDLLVLYPALTHDSTVTLRYVEVPPLPTSEDVTLRLPDEDVPLLLDALEVCLLAKHRTLEPLVGLAARLTARVQGFARGQG